MTALKRQVLLGCAMLVAGLLLLAGCNGTSSPDDGKPQGELRIALNIWPGYGAFLIAEEKGFFADEGATVKIEIIQGDPEREAALVAGKIDGIGMTMDNLVILRSKGVGVKAIYKYDGSFGADGIVAKKSIQTAKELAGKKVAWAPGTTSHFFLTQVLKQVGLRTKDLGHVAMSSDDAGAAFAAGKLDAAVTWEPWLSKARELPGGKVLVTTKEMPVVEDVLFVRNEVLEKRRAVVVKMLKACFRAVEYWKKHPEEAKAIIARKFKMPVNDVGEMLGGIKIMNLSDNKAFFGDGGPSSPAAKAFDAATEAWLEEGLIKVGEPAKNGIDASLVADIKQ